LNPDIPDGSRERKRTTLEEKGVIDDEDPNIGHDFDDM
jgi:hypothetical protein